NKSEHGHKISLHIGDCLQLIPQFPYMFDVVFIDGNKRHYIDYYEAAMSKLNSRGFIFVDNTLWDGHVIDKHIEATDFQTQGIIAFNTHVKQDTRVETAIFPIRDGITVLYKK
ncbi:MAG TPA: methyltransferase, partial [Bacteroidales bacterium]|nr:methyltransferase [Bacteroidales bacterium]